MDCLSFNVDICQTSAMVPKKKKKKTLCACDSNCETCVKHRKYHWVLPHAKSKSGTVNDSSS